MKDKIYHVDNLKDKIKNIRKELIKLKKLLGMDLLTKKDFNEKAVELKKIILDK